MNLVDSIPIGRKLIGSFLIIAAIVGIVAIIGYSNMKTINDGMTTMYNDRLVPIQDLGTADAKFYDIRGDLYKYLAIPQDRKTLKISFEEKIGTINLLIDKYRETSLLDSEKAELAKFDTSWPEYQKLLRESLIKVDAGKEEEVIASLIDGDLHKTRKSVDESLTNLLEINKKEAERINTESDVIFANSVLLMTIAGILGVLVALILGFVISRGITIPLNKTVLMIQEMGKGHLGMRLTMNRKDEIGIMAGTMDTFADDLQQKVIGIMKQIATGEKVQQIPPVDDQDEIAPALNQMIQTLDSLIYQVGSLIGEAKQGRLQARGEEIQFLGLYRDIIAGINEMLESITKPINETLRVAERYANVDFSAQFDDKVEVNGDFHTLKEMMNAIGMHVGKELAGALESVNTQIAELTASSEEAASSIEEVCSGSTMIAQSAANVNVNAEAGKQSVEQILVAMEELSTSVATVTARIDSVNRLSQDADLSSTKGIEQAAAAEKGINEINGAVSDVGSIITEIREQMGEIGKIVEIIGAIADQTNLLALNAAIEAARAGDAGMGFAVVANEVKTLAQESQGSAENIAKIITSLQKQSERAATAMNLATNNVSKGSAAITDTIQSFHHIAEQIKDISKNMTDVASLSEEEAAAVEEITATISELKNVTQNTAEESMSSASACQEATCSINQVTEVVSKLSIIAARISEAMSRLTVSHG